jgi:hypothetical protein
MAGWLIELNGGMAKRSISTFPLCPYSTFHREILSDLKIIANLF